MGPCYDVPKKTPLLKCTKHLFIFTITFKIFTRHCFVLNGETNFQNRMKCDTIFLEHNFLYEEESFHTLRKRCYCLLCGWGIHEPKQLIFGLSKIFCFFNLFDYSLVYRIKTTNKSTGDQQHRNKIMHTKSVLCCRNRYLLWVWPGAHDHQRSSILCTRLMCGA